MAQILLSNFMQGVAEIVARRAAADAAQGNVHAERCVSLIDRKIVKQTVMTSVYGVTAVGARTQIENRLRERRTDMKHKAELLHEQRHSSGQSAGDAQHSWLLAGIRGAGELGVVAPGMHDEYRWMDDKDSVWQVSLGRGWHQSCCWLSCASWVMTVRRRDTSKLGWMVFSRYRDSVCRFCNALLTALGGHHECTHV